MIVTGTVPSAIDTALRNYPEVPPDLPAGLWSVWALSTADLSRGSRAAVLGAYQLAVPPFELSSESNEGTVAAITDGQAPGEMQSDTANDEASSGDRVRRSSPPILLELPVRSGSAIQRMTGPLAEAVLMAEHQIRNLMEATSPEMIWELRALHVPALYLEALWLYSLSGRPDIVVPYASGVEGIETFREQPLRRMLQLAANTPRPAWPEV